MAGPWDDLTEPQRQQFREAQAEVKRLQMERDASRNRSLDIIAELAAHGITAHRVSTRGAITNIRLPLAEAEKLIALLGAKNEQGD